MCLEEGLALGEISPWVETLNYSVYQMFIEPLVWRNLSCNNNCQLLTIERVGYWYRLGSLETEFGHRMFIRE